MNLLLYLTLLIIVFLYITPTINCDNDNKIYECNEKNINVLYDISNDAKSKLPCLPMSSSCSLFKKKFKNNKIINKPIYEGPEISELLLMGIKTTIRFSKKSTDKDTYRFYERMNSFVDIPLPTKGFKFRAFAPDNFLTLRNLYNISEDFDTTFQTLKIYAGITYGDFINTYYYTTDLKFYINIITVENFEFIVSFLPKYFSHYCKNQLSLLPKIAGLFYIKHKKFEFYFILKPYIFPNVPISMDKVYYTKGMPEKGSLILDGKFNSEACQKEEDILEFYKKGLIIPFDTYKSLQKVIIKDTEFLKSLDISDYIFMLSVSPSDKSYNKLQTALVNKLSDVTNPDSRDMKTSNSNLIAYIGIDNIYQKRNKADHSYHTFLHFHCKFKHQVNQNPFYSVRFAEVIMKQVFKSNEK